MDGGRESARRKGVFRDFAIDGLGRSFQIPVTGGDLFPIKTTWDFECEMVWLKSDIPGEDETTTAWGREGGAVNDLWTSYTKAEGWTWSRNGMAPVSAIL
jgi:hypothetical protein